MALSGPQKGQGDHGHHGDQYPHSNIKSKLTECIAVFMNLTGSAPLAVVNISLSYRTAFQLVHCNNCTLRVLSIVFVLYLSAFIWKCTKPGEGIANYNDAPSMCGRQFLGRRQIREMIIKFHCRLLSTIYVCIQPTFTKFYILTIPLLTTQTWKHIYNIDLFHCWYPMGVY